jgi:4-hydroxybenzoyl-CoA reductase beta subunit
MATMHLPKFEHLCPASIEEAAHLLDRHGANARLAAGGTDLFPRMKQGLTRPEVVISLKGLNIDPPRVNRKGELHINALMPLADIARSPEVLEKAPLLAEAITAVGSNQIRHMGTLGGNICLENRCTYYNQSHSFQFVDPCFKRSGDRCYLIPKGKKCVAVFSADTVPALICLDAKVEIIASDNSRQLPVEKLYTGNALQPLVLSQDEIISEVIIANPKTVRGAAFNKFSIRGGVEFAGLTVAVCLEMANGAGTCAAARITAGAVSAGPVRAIKAEKAMTGETLSDTLFQKIAEMVAGEIRPVMHHGYSAPFLRECLKVQTYRTLVLGAERTGQYSKK